MAQKTIYSVVGKIRCKKLIDGITPEPTLMFMDAQSHWIKHTVERICKEHGRGSVRVTLEYLGTDYIGEN